jgi:hypothetical protein
VSRESKSATRTLATRSEKTYMTVSEYPANDSLRTASWWRLTRWNYIWLNPALKAADKLQPSSRPSSRLPLPLQCSR